MTKRYISLLGADGLASKQQTETAAGPKYWSELLASIEHLRAFIVTAQAAVPPNDISDRQRTNLLRELHRLSRLAQNTLERVTLKAEQHWAIHWRDDDSPQYECTHGTRRTIFMEAA